MSRNENELSLSLLKSNTSLASRKRAVAEAKKNNDQVFMVLYSDNLTYRDMKMLVSGFKNTARAKDILMAYRMLSTLLKYLDESESWSFNMLNNYDFQRAVRQFDLDVAIVVGARAERLLSEIYSWNIPHLKKTVMGFSSYASDDATILTILVFRILNEYSTLEFTLQLALSRATLIKIHHEMSSLFSKLPGGDENSQFSSEERNRNDALVNAYRNFVTSLLDELESTPFESVQQELFQIVRDLHSMFYKFSDSQQNLKPLEGPKAQQASTEQTHASKSSRYESGNDSPANEKDILEDLFQPKQEENFLNLRDSVHSASHSTTSSTLPPLQEEWQSPDSPSQHKARKPRIPGADIPFSNNRGRTVSGSTNRTTSSVVSNLTEGLPAMLQAFEIARRRNEQLKNPLGNKGSESSLKQAASVNSTMNTPPDTPSRSVAADSSFLDAGTKTPNSTTYGPSTPLSGSNPKKSTRNSGTPSQFGGNIRSPTSAAGEPVVDEQTVQMKMINGRMMVKVEGKYVDMQEWADKTNTITEANVQSAQHPSYSITNNENIHHSMAGSLSNSNIHSVLHAEPASPSPSASIKSSFSINTQDSTSTLATSVSSLSPITTNIKSVQPEAVASPTNDSNMASSGSAYGISTLFQPWFKQNKPPVTTITAAPAPVETFDATKNSIPKISTPPPVATISKPQLTKNGASPSASSNKINSITGDGVKPASTLEFLQKQQKKNQPIQNQPQPMRAPTSMMGFPTMKPSMGIIPTPAGMPMNNAMASMLQAPVPAIAHPSQRAAMNSSSWIKGLMGPPEAYFPKNYNN